MLRLSAIRMGACVALLVPLCVSAHHAMDPRDGKPIELTGIINYISWDGAHVMYRVRTTDEAGEGKLWLVLGASPKILSMRQIGKETMKVGEKVTVNGSYNPYTKEIAPYFFKTADGHQYEMGFYPPTALPRK